MINYRKLLFFPFLVIASSYNMAVADSPFKIDPCENVMPKFNLSMTLLNVDQPFVSKEFSKRLALLVLDEKYPKDIFVYEESVTVTDNGETWVVIVNNSIFSEDRASLGSIIPRRLSVEIRKANGEIIGIS